MQSSGSLNNTSGGTIQLCVNQTRYLICDDGWDFFSASILCQSLGYSPYGIISCHGYPSTAHLVLHIYVHVGAVALQHQWLTSSAYYGIPLLSNITCDGTESTFAECYYELANTTYCYSGFAGVYCQGSILFIFIKARLLLLVFLYKHTLALGTIPDNCTQGDMKLIGGSTEYEGTIQVCVNSVWGTVCDSSWNYYDAVVACSQLGYGGLGQPLNFWDPKFMKMISFNIV